MQRQMNADELNEFYRRVGAAIWHVQYLEDVLVSFLAMKILGPKRSGGQAISADEMNALLAQERRLTLGRLIEACTCQNIISAPLQARFETFKTDRHWLVHRSVVESGDDLYNRKPRRYSASGRRTYSGIGCPARRYCGRKAVSQSIRSGRRAGHL